MFRSRRITETHLIFIIVSAGALLRLWRFEDIPFTHDEYSAIIRTGYDTFGELIRRGVMVDGHPAGVQWLMWLMASPGEPPSAWLKLPFVLFSLGSIFLTYLIGKRWFNSTTGLISASFMAFLQFPVMYGQIARPYSSGLFFSLLMVWFWSNILFRHDRRLMANLAGFAITATISALNHHFAMLFAVITGVTGLFLVDKTIWRKYVIACGVAIILYLPHLQVLLAQLQLGGVEGWLKKPRFDFITDYLQYVFQFSVFIYLLLILLAGLAIAWYRRSEPLNTRMLVVSVIWVVLPFLIGYLYSVFRNAVLQYSVMIFSAPYLFFLVGGLFNTRKMVHKVILVLLIAVVVIPSLIYDRQHFTLFYRNPYREMVREATQVQSRYGNERVAVMLDTRKEINRFIMQDSAFRGLKFLYLDDIGGRGKLRRYLQQLPHEMVAFGTLASSSWDHYPVIRSVYPHLVSHRCYAGGDFYLFSRRPQRVPMEEYFREFVNDFEPVPPHWVNVDPVKCKDSMPVRGLFSYHVDSTSEYSPTFTMGLRDMIDNPDNEVDISVEVRLPGIFTGAWLVATITSGDRTIYWTSVPLNDYVNPGEVGQVHLTLRISDMELRHHHLRLTTYIWNPLRLVYEMDHFTVKVRRGNNFLYGLFREVRGTCLKSETPRSL